MTVKLRTRKLKGGGESFYLDIYHKGKRSYQFLGLKVYRDDKDKKSKKALAERIRSKKELELHSNIHGIPNYSNGDEDFLKYYEVNCNDQSYKSSFKKLKIFSNNKLVSGILPLNCIDEKFCESYKLWLLTDVENKVSNNTTWVYITKLKTVLNKAVREKLLTSNPAKYVKVKNIEAEKTYLNYDELLKLNKTECENEELKKAFLFACYTGLRLSDIKALTLGQIRSNKLYFRQIKTKGVEYLPLSKTALALIEDLVAERKPDERIFQIKLVRSETIGYNLRKWAKGAGINKYITFHTSRHTFATLSLTYGVDLYTVSKLLGHKSIKMTEIYAKIVNEKADEAVNKLPIL